MRHVGVADVFPVLQRRDAVQAFPFENEWPGNENGDGEMTYRPLAVAERDRETAL